MFVAVGVFDLRGLRSIIHIWLLLFFVCVCVPIFFSEDVVRMRMTVDEYQTGAVTQTRKCCTVLLSL